MKKHLIVAGFFASFALILSYLAFTFIKADRAWLFALLLGGALFLILAPVFFFTGLKRAARYDAYEKSLTEGFRERFALSFREKGGLHADARLYILENGFRLVDLKGKKTSDRLIKWDEVTSFDLSGEDVEVYLVSGELIFLETGEKDKLMPYLEKKNEGEDKNDLSV